MTPKTGHTRMLYERLLLEQSRLDDVRELLREPAVAARLGADTALVLQRLLARQNASYSTYLAGTELTWTGLHQRVQITDRVLAECLAVLAGRFTRSVPPVERLCAEAETVARELHTLTRLAADHAVIPADAECAGLTSSVVRRRYPDHGVWDLPVVGHEFGHLVARDLLDTDPISGDTRRPLADLLAGQHARNAELAADVFAVYVLGAAYVLTLVLHRMNPMAAAVAQADATHPSDPSRVAGALHTLTLLAADEVETRRGQYAFYVEQIGRWWADAQSGAPSTARLDDGGAARVRRDTERVWETLARSTLADVRYRSFAAARALADDLGDERAPGAADSCRDVLNAAWLVRFRAWRDGVELPEAVTAWARAELHRLASAEVAERG